MIDQRFKKSMMKQYDCMVLNNAFRSMPLNQLLLKTTKTSGKRTIRKRKAVVEGVKRTRKIKQTPKSS